MGHMNCCKHFAYLTVQRVLSGKKVPPACRPPLPLCHKYPLLAAIHRWQQVEKIFKKSTIILWTNLIWIKTGANQQQMVPPLSQVLLKVSYYYLPGTFSLPL